MLLDDIVSAAVELRHKGATDLELHTWLYDPWFDEDGPALPPLLSPDDRVWFKGDTKPTPHEAYVQLGIHIPCGQPGCTAHNVLSKEFTTYDVSWLKEMNITL